MSHSATVEQCQCNNTSMRKMGRQGWEGGHGLLCPSPNGTCFLTNTCISTNKTCSTTGLWKPPTIGVFLCFLLTLTHAEHENTPNMVCFHAWHLSYTPTHAKHKETPSMVSVCAQRHSYIQQHMLNMKRHHWRCLSGVFSYLVSFWHISPWFKRYCLSVVYFFSTTKGPALCVYNLYIF